LFSKRQATLIRCPGAQPVRYTIPDSVTHIGNGAFYKCAGLTNVTIPASVSSIGDRAFYGCTGLTIVTIPNSVTSIGWYAFSGCTGLRTVVIPNSVTSLGLRAFYGCPGLMGAYFEGNAPADSYEAFHETPATIYFLPGTTGWSPVYSYRPTALWVRPQPVILDFGPSFGVQPDGFGFIVSWATNASVLVEACTNLAEPAWTPVSTHTLTSGTATFTDPDWAQSPARFYRARSE
jgi:hypothetical protein